MTFDEVEKYLENGTGIIILPLGSTEEHGPHGPMGTDTFAARIVARNVAERLDAVLAPAVPFGMCFDQRHFKGTIALKPSTYAFLLKEICQNFIRDGYRLVLAISGHRGNDHAAISGLQEAAWESETHVLYMCYQDANKGRLAEVLGPDAARHIKPEDLAYGADGHGGSVELSIAEAHAPESVRMDKRTKPDRGPVDMLRSFPFRAVLNIEEIAPTDGFFGDPEITSPKLGEQIVTRTSEKIAADVRRFLDAFPKRTTRGG
ncbi:MAG: creatininase family protein [Casimicrobiaceae bacterium]